MELPLLPTLESTDPPDGISSCVSSLERCVGLGSRTNREKKMAAFERQREGEREGEREECDEKICRYCFDGEESGELISPCRCTGGESLSLSFSLISNHRAEVGSFGLFKTMAGEREREIFIFSDCVFRGW
jgi:hypothetical protein